MKLFWHDREVKPFQYTVVSFLASRHELGEG